MLKNVQKKPPYYLFKSADNGRLGGRGDGEAGGGVGIGGGGGKRPRQKEKAILCAAVASLFSVLTDARAQPLDEWPCAE